MQRAFISITISCIPTYHRCRNGNVLFIGAYGLDNQPLELVQDGLNKRIL